MSSKVSKSTLPSKSARSPKHKSSKPSSHSSSSRHQKYKSKYQTRRSKERKEKKHSPSLQALLHEDSKKCRLPAKRNIRFEDDKKLVTSKYFSITDEPTAQALNEEQVANIRKKVAQQMSTAFPAFCSSEEIKHKESLMEGLRRRQNEKEMVTKLDEMKPVINWSQPIEFSMEEKYVWGDDSTEIEAHDKRMSTKLRCFYPTADHIPAEPNFVIINNKYSVKQVQQIQLYPFKSSDPIQDFDQQQISKQEAVEVSVKQSINLKQPKKSILRKSREQILKEKEEEEKKQQFIKEKQKKEKEILKEKKKKEKLAKENAKKLAPETLKKFMAVLQSSGTPTPEQAEELKQIMKSIHDQGIDTQSIIQHIKLLKETVLKSSSKKIRKDHIKAPFQQGAQQQQQQYSQQHQLQQKFSLINQSLHYNLFKFNYFTFQDFSNKSKFFRNKKLQLFAQKKFMMQQPPQPNIINSAPLQQPKFPTQPLNFPSDQNQQQPQQQDQQQVPFPQVQNILDPKLQTEEKKIEDDPQRSKSPSLPQQQPEQIDISQQQSQQSLVQQPQQSQQQQQQFPNYQQFPLQQNQYPKQFPKFRNNQNIPQNMPPQAINNPNFIPPSQYPPNQPTQPNQPNQFPPMQQQRPFNKNYKRVPCTKFHSPQGCMFGERCNFIHDYNYAGVPSPNMYKYVNQKQIKQMTIPPQDQMPEQQLQQQPGQPGQNPNFMHKNQQFQQQQQPQFGALPQESFLPFQQQQQQQFNYYNQQQPPQKYNNNMPFNQRFHGMNHFKNQQQYQNMPNMQNIQNIQNHEFNDMNLNMNENEQMQEE